jgi:hypothetical protein
VSLVKVEASINPKRKLVFHIIILLSDVESEFITRCLSFKKTLQLFSRDDDDTKYPRYRHTGLDPISANLNLKNLFYPRKARKTRKETRTKNK